MGRAYRVLKRTAHLTVHVAERAEKIVVAAPPVEAPKRARRPPAAGRKPAVKRTSRSKKAKE
jgi:hypothetical protein